MILANPNPVKSIEPKLLEISKSEFLENGYKDVSIKLICSKAGVTTGAFYKRFKSKDELFTALNKNLLVNLSNYAVELYELYKKAEQTKSIEDIFYAISVEENYYLNIIFDYYDECKLIICKGFGSKLHEQLEMRIDKKISDTHNFLQIVQGKEIDFHLVDLVLKQEVNTFRYILDNNFDKSKAQAFLSSMNKFYIEGWKLIFNGE